VIGYSRVHMEPGVHDGRGRFSEITCFPLVYVPALVRWAGIVSGIPTQRSCARCKWT
jgi:hypothetical protein